MAFRLLLIMAMGLGAMYMMHLLAQDYNKIRKPVAAATRMLISSSGELMRGKRHTSDLRFRNKDSNNQTFNNGTPNVNWKRILSRDAFGCLESFICQLMSGAESNCKEAIILKSFIESSLNEAPTKLTRSFVRGLTFYGTSYRCFDEYPYCLYSAKTMLRILRWFSELEPSDKTLFGENHISR